MTSMTLISSISARAAAATLATALCVSVASADLSDTDQISPCLASHLSPIGQAACAEIAGAGDVSDASYYNHFPSDWLLLLEPGGAVSPVNAYYGELASMLAETWSTMEIATLKLSGDKSILAEGLLKLHGSRASEKADAPKPLVRLLVGSGEVDVENALEAITRHLPADRDAWNVDVVVARIGREPLYFWNHAKMAVRDRFEAVTGSVELHGETELAMKVSCHAARDARDFFDAVWETYPERSSVTRACASNREDLCTETCFEQECWSSGRPSPPSAWCGVQEAPVLSLGRGNFIDGGGLELDLSADRAIYAALDSAHHDLFLMQRSLIFKPLHVDRLFDSLANAAIRGVDVRITVGPDAGWLGYFPAPEVVWDRLVDHMDDEFRAQGLSREQRRQAHRRVRLAEYNAHVKYFSVDDQAFYV
ncbi:MAG: hypothetical protein AAFX03_13820, partial [Pseudomonadota bacterium]